jgi:hypothetical protein
MASIINASSTGSGGIVQTADASGVLQLQTNGTTAVTVATSANVGIGEASPTSKLIVNSGANTTVAGFNSTGSSAFIGMANSGATTFIGNDSTSGSFVVQTPGSSFATKLTISPAGYVTTPYQPMFSVYKSNGSVTGSSGGVQIVYNAVQVNVSSGYDTGNGYFTAPSAGTYYFSAMGMASSVTGNYDLQLQIQVNGSSIVISNPPVANSTQQGINFACSCIATLAAGDSVRVVYYSSTATVFYAGGGTFNNFCGFLIG